MSNASSVSGCVNPLLAAALAYGKLGWKVFPIREGTKDAPHLREWGVFATSNPKQITEWWTKWPRENIGLACGPSFIAVVDVDTKEGKNGQRTIDLWRFRWPALVADADAANAQRRPAVFLCRRGR